MIGKSSVKTVCLAYLLQGIAPYKTNIFFSEKNSNTQRPLRLIKKNEMDKRPVLCKETSIQDFQDFYWLKEELVKFCRSEALKTTGSKIEISDRIENYLKTGQRRSKQVNHNIKPVSRFDWKNEELSLDTEITDNYKNTENVRIFFQQQIGKHFKFNVKFMSWMKSSSGKTLNDAIKQWERINAQMKDKTKAKEIAPQFEYNRYLRDFSVDNPNSRRELGIKLWNIKKSLRGDNQYSKDDLKLI